MPPRPLRTGRARFPASGSSLRERLWRDAAWLVPTLARYLAVAVGREQLPVVQAVTAALRTPNPMVDLPVLSVDPAIAAQLRRRLRVAPGPVARSAPRSASGGPGTAAVPGLTGPTPVGPLLALWPWLLPWLGEER
jgi:hypothetical protein